MSANVLIVFAQLAEAKHLIAKTKAKPVAGAVISVWGEGIVSSYYRFDRGAIAISNVGLHAAQMCVAKYGSDFDEIWNAGLAGSLKANSSLFEIIPIECVGKYIPLSETLDSGSRECVAATLPHFVMDREGGRLISSDFPVHQKKDREELARAWDLVDMEGYGIAFAAAALNKKCRMWKVVSDFVSPEGRELIRKHKGDLAEKIANKIIEHL